MAEKTEMDDFIARAQTEYRASLPEKLDVLGRWIEALEGDPKLTQELQRMFDAVHRLSGTAGSFGLDEIGRIADEWERTIRDLRTHPVSSSDFTAMRPFITRIRQLL